MAVILILLTLLLPVLPTSAAGLTLEIEGRYQSPGGAVMIHGSTEPLVNVSLVVISSLGETLLNTTIEADEEGEYSITLTLGVDVPPGIYQVYVEAEGETAEGSFTVVSALNTLAENLINIANRSRGEVEAMLDQLSQAGVEIPEEAMEGYETALTALEEALKALEEGELDSAIEEAMEALKHFKEALQHLSEEVPPPPAEAAAEEIRGLRVAIERAYEFAERVRDLAEKLEEGYEVGEALSLLEEAEAHLAEAERLLEEGDVDGAARELAWARGLLGRAWALLQVAMTPVREMRIGRFLNHTEKRIEALKARIEALRDEIPEEKLNRSLEKLEEVADSLAIGQNWKEDQRIILFVKLNPGYTLTEDLEDRIRKTLRREASPRHVPALIIEVPDIPYTLNMKKVESAVTNIIHGRPVVNRDALINPDSLEYYESILPMLQQGE